MYLLDVILLEHTISTDDVSPFLWIPAQRSLIQKDTQEVLISKLQKQNLDPIF